MNPHILEFAAIFVNSYRNACQSKGLPLCERTLRNHIENKFGAVYAAILCR